MQNITIWLEHNFDVVSQKNGQELTICCPFCTNDTSYHLSVSTVKNVWQCWKCGRSGNHVKLVMCYENISYHEAKKKIRNPRVAGDYDREKIKGIWMDEVVNEDFAYKPHHGMPDWFTPLLPPKGGKEVFPILHFAKRRLENNRVAANVIIREYNFGLLLKKNVTKDNKKFLGRLIIPIEDSYFQARLVKGKHSAKYLNPDIPLEHRVFNAKALDAYYHINIAEGVFDALAIGSNAISVLGSKINAHQARRIVNSDVTHITLCPDSGYHFTVGTVNAADYFKSKGIEVDIRLYKREDPAECDEFDTEHYNFKYKVLAKLGGNRVIE